jgi:hypothetical protein
MGEITSSLHSPLSVHHRLTLTMRLVVHSSAYSQNAETVRLSPGQDERKRSVWSCHHWVGGTPDRWLRLWETADWGRYRLGLVGRLKLAQ